MTITASEMFGRTLSLQSGTKVYLLTSDDPNNDTDEDARDQLIADAPNALAGLPRSNADVEEIEGDNSNERKWIGQVTYRAGRQASGSTAFRFDTTGGTEHLTHSLATISSHAANGNPTDYKGAIGVTKDNVEGVDITVAQFGYTVTRTVKSSDMTDAYIETIESLTGTTNNGAFSVTTDDGVTLTLATGENLFLGAQGEFRESEDDWQIRFRFAKSRNKANIQVGPMTGISKKGWEYLWVRYAEEEDANSGRLAKRPIEAYVEKVYEEGNHDALDL